MYTLYTINYVIHEGLTMGGESLQRLKSETGYNLSSLAKLFLKKKERRNNLLRTFVCLEGKKILKEREKKKIQIPLLILCGSQISCEP